MMDFSNNVLMEGTIGADLVRYNNALVYLSIKGTPMCVCTCGTACVNVVCVVSCFE
jgi:hypothetical protein